MKAPPDPPGLLHAAYEQQAQLQDYWAPKIDGVRFIPLTRQVDDGGSFTELLRTSAAVTNPLSAFVLRQVNWSEVTLGPIKAYHLHKKQTDIWYVPPSDTLLVVLADLRSSTSEEIRAKGAAAAYRAAMEIEKRPPIQRVVLGNGRAGLLVIPPGVAHGCRALGAKATLLYFVDQEFSLDRERCDEFRLPWDQWGRDVWERTNG